MATAIRLRSSERSFTAVPRFEGNWTLESLPLSGRKPSRHPDVQKATRGSPRGEFAHGHAARGDDSDEKNIKKRIEKDIESQLNETAGSVTRKFTLVLPETPEKRR
jgi:hypothetical protein